MNIETIRSGKSGPALKTYIAGIACLLLTGMVLTAGCGSGGGNGGQPSAIYSAWGMVGGAANGGVTVTLTGADTITRTATSGVIPLHVSGNLKKQGYQDVRGVYGFGGLTDGIYTVTPSLAGYAFTPASITFTITDTDVSDLNFTAEAITPSAY